MDLLFQIPPLICSSLNLLINSDRFISLATAIDNCWPKIFNSGSLSNSLEITGNSPKFKK